MRLFEQSARRVRLDFSLEREQQHVAEICRLVEGMPLALEMSVSWLRVLKAADIAKELGRDLDILTAQFQNFPDRHRSMRVVIEHSWAMLAEQEADVLMRLSVFAGGFRKEAAVQVADASIRLLARLVDKSFVSVDETARYYLHELVRRFASERLNEASERAVATRTRHSEYYLALQRIPLLLCHRFTV